ncbi:MAG TPA: hypothetical protein VLV48_07760, partial [Thermoanaerobaculia bacterium]|nr:hypothetical protein [Thermoanaerobaculia bacterium]
PNVASSQATTPTTRKRLVKRGSGTGPTANAEGASLATELWLYNPGATEALIELALTDAGGGKRSLEVALAPRATRRYADAVASIAGGSSSGSLTITPRRGEIAATARLRIAEACGVCGADLPVLPAGQGLRVGQTQRFSGLESASAATVAARKPGTFRTGFGIVETTGASVKVRASLKLANGRSPIATILSRDVTVAPGSTVAFADLAAALFGPARGEADLHDLQVDFEVVDGAGSAVVYVTSTDNATGDTIVRTE